MFRVHFFWLARCTAAATLTVLTCNGESREQIEIGGNKGVFAHKLTSAYNIGAMHIIEPVTPMVEKLKKRFAGVLNAKGAPAAHIHKWAVGPEQTQLRMAYRSSTDAAAKFLMGDETIESLGWTGATVETVEVKTFPQAWVAMGVEMVDLVGSASAVSAAGGPRGGVSGVGGGWLQDHAPICQRLHLQLRLGHCCT